MPRGAIGSEYIEIECNGGVAQGTRKFKIAQDRGRPLWTVGEIEDGRGPFADYIANDWRFGAGLNRFTGLNETGHVLRIADGYGIDLSNGKIEHGPGGTDIGNISGTIQKKMVLFDNEVWILTSTHLYRYDGTTFTDYWGPAASGATHETYGGSTLKDMEVFEGNLYICDGTNIFFTDGTDDPNTNQVQNGEAADQAADFLLAIQTATAPQLWIAYSTNKIRSTNDPDAADPTWSTDIEVGAGEAITNLLSISGLLFVATASTIFSISSDGLPIELDKRLQTRRSASAFSIKSEIGSEAWLSDGSADALWVRAVDFEQFEIVPSGPFNDDSLLPFTEEDSRGNITAITQDVKYVYVVVDRGSDVYVYKGAEQGRGVWGWSPFIRLASTTNGAAGVFKLTTDSEAFLYINAGTDIYKFKLRDWTTYAASWQVTFPYFDNGDENEIKVWHRLLVFIEEENDAAQGGTIQAAARRDGTTAFTNLGSPFNSDGPNTVVVAIQNGRRIQLRLTNTSTDTDDKIDVRSIRLEGVRKPELKQLFDFTVLVENEAEADFLVNCRREATAFVLIKDMGGTQRQGIVLPGYPQEIISAPEVVNGWQRAYRVRMQEVLSL